MTLYSSAIGMPGRITSTSSGDTGGSFTPELQDTAATTAAEGTGSFLTSPGGLVLIGAVTVGVAVLLLTGDDDAPVSPSR